jgi:hypothetical protein
MILTSLTLGELEVEMVGEVNFARWLRGVCFCPVSWSTSTACLWLKVPRSTSCPVRRTYAGKKTV